MVKCGVVDLLVHRGAITYSNYRTATVQRIEVCRLMIEAMIQLKIMLSEK